MGPFTQEVAPGALKRYFLTDESGGVHEVPVGTTGAQELPEGSSIGEDHQLYDERTPVGVFSKAFGAVTGADTPGKSRETTSWPQAYANTVRSFLPYTNERESAVPDAVMGLMAPFEAMKNNPDPRTLSDRERAEVAMGTFGLQGLGHAAVGGGQSVLGQLGKKAGLSDPLLTGDAASPVAMASGDEKAALLNRQQPFYGEEVGPKGRIAAPLETTQALGLRSGVAGAPADGFFNPATSALLQEGVAKKQTLTYYKKQMGSRGGKLPPGMWEKATEGLRPDETIARDDLVKRIDSFAPQIEKRSAWDEDASGPTQERLQGNYEANGYDDNGGPQYQDYATQGPFKNYTETAVGYPSMKARIDNAQLGWKPGDPYIKVDKNPNDVGVFRDNHFEHPNLEGWYRTQDYAKPKEGIAYDGKPYKYVYDKTRILEEVQPQRYQKMRDLGAGVDSRQMTEWSRQRDLARTNTQYVRNDMQTIWDRYQDKLTDHQKNMFGFEDIVTELRKVATPEDVQKINALAEDFRTYSDKVRHFDGQIVSSKKGVQPSPFTHDVNAATDMLLKNAVNDATMDGIDRLAWTPGEAQAERYNQLLRDVKALKYDPDNERLFVQRADGTGGHDTHRVTPDKLTETVGADAANRLMSSPRGEFDVGVSKYQGHTVDFGDQGMTLGGEGMKGFYGSGPLAEGGILKDRIQSLWRKITGRAPQVEPQSILTGNSSPRRGGRVPSDGKQYPSVELPLDMRGKIKRTGLPLFSSGDERAAATAAFMDHDAPFFGDVPGTSADTTPSAPFVKRMEGELFDYGLQDGMPVGNPLGIPDQPYYDGARGMPERMSAIVDNGKVTRRVNKAVEKGLAENPNAALNWYNNEPLRARFHDLYTGPGSPDTAFRSYMEAVGATSPQNPALPNAAHATQVYSRALKGEEIPRDPSQIRAPGFDTPGAGTRLIVARKKFGQEPGYDPADAPKTEYFGRSLAGSDLRAVIDSHASRLLAMSSEDPRFVNTYQRYYDPQAQAYRSYNPSEMLASGDIGKKKLMQEPTWWWSRPTKAEYQYAAKPFERAAKKFGISTGQAQAAAWYGAAEQTGVKTPPKTFNELFEQRLRENAQERGVSPETLLRDVINGRAVLFSGGGLSGLSAAPFALEETGE